MPRVGEPTREDPLPEGFGDPVRDDDAAEWQVAGVDSLRKCDEVRRASPMIHCEPLAAPAEARHDLIRDEHDPEFIADLTDTGEIARWWDEHPVRPDDGLQEN